TGLQIPERLVDALPWMSQHVEDIETGLRRADSGFVATGSRFLLVFDALDRLGRDWASIRKLTVALLRFALELRSYRALRAKLFLRTDQAHDERLFRFADASKLRAEAVDLTWRHVDLYGLIYNFLW